jgi:hypothetical protein
MRLLVLNGSPRGERSNTGLLLRPFLEGFTSAGGVVAGTHLLARATEADEALRAFGAVDAVLLAFPLYGDALPAPALSLVQRLAPRVGRRGNPAMLFLVQNGFPEALHMRPVERWLEKLSRRLGAPHLGTMVKPGAEGIRDRPPAMERRGFERLEALGIGLASTGRLEPRLLAELAGRERLGEGVLGPLRLAAGARLAAWWWNRQLKANGALGASDARPYAPGADAAS